MPRSRAETPRAPRNRVRIIGGEWRSRILQFPARPDLRPTPDRVRETLFNWLGQDLTGKACLDLFAGSGALGLEAASRGARRVVMIEREVAVADALRASIRQLAARAVEVRQTDALEFLHIADGKYDVVFLDPPFRSDILPMVFPILGRCLARDAMVHVEAPAVPVLPAGYQVWRSGRAGVVNHLLLKWTGDETQSGISGHV